MSVDSDKLDSKTQFSKVDCVNKELIQRLKDHLTNSYKLGKCKIIEKDQLSQTSAKDTESLSVESNECNSDFSANKNATESD